MNAAFSGEGSRHYPKVETAHVVSVGFFFFLENNSVCSLKRGVRGDFSVPPPILSPLVDGSSNRHDWLTSRPVPFWDLQLSLA